MRARFALTLPDGFVLLLILQEVGVHLEDILKRKEVSFSERLHPVTRSTAIKWQEVRCNQAQLPVTALSICVIHKAIKEPSHLNCL